MIAKPCIRCGTPTSGTHCADCRPKDTRTNRSHVAFKNNTGWKQLSQRVRAASPFCEFCGNTNNLCADHILPTSDYPELTYAVENLRVLCLSCNGTRGNRFTPDEAHTVLTRLLDTYNRRPTKKGQTRLAAAQRATQTHPGATQTTLPRPVGKAQRPLHTAGGPL